MITIPPAALEAAARAIYEADHLVSWDVPSKTTRDEWRDIARAAALALLENWPGVKYKSKAKIDDFETGELNWEKFIILPLDTQENENG